MSTATTTLSLEIPLEIDEQLQRLAKATGQTTTWLAQEALRSFTDLYEWQTRAIRQGMADADTGHTVAHEEVVTWLESWGTDDELPAPRCD